jgi:predicted metalloendopeptidase
MALTSICYIIKLFYFITIFISFNLDLPGAYNFAAIGSTMGHEITRGFATTGRRIYLDGISMKDPGWWTQKSLKEFHGKKECLKGQYEKYEVKLLVAINKNGINMKVPNVLPNDNV